MAERVGIMGAKERDSVARHRETRTSPLSGGQEMWCVGVLVTGEEAGLGGRRAKGKECGHRVKPPGRSRLRGLGSGRGVH